MSQQYQYYQQSLELEVSLLGALLQRSRCGHSKTKYYQRMSMALRALNRFQLLELHEKLNRWNETLQEKRKNQKDELWDAKKLASTDTTVATLQSVQNSIRVGIPRVLSRLEYASESLFWQVSRGFFLPLCTVALGTVARIRVLLMRLGHHFLDNLIHAKSNAQTSIRKLFLTNEEIEQLRNAFTEPPDTVESVPRKKRYQKLMEFVGLSEPLQEETIEEKQSENQESNPKRSSSEEASTNPDNHIREDDIGEAVVSSRDDTQDRQPSVQQSIQPQPKKRSPKQPTKANSETSTRITGSAAAGLERKKREEETKQTTKREKTKKEKKRRAKESAGKAEKKKKKEDFFDRLFG